MTGPELPPSAPFAGLESPGSVLVGGLLRCRRIAARPAGVASGSPLVGAAPRRDGLGIAIVAFFVAVVAGRIGRTQTQLDDADDGPVAIGTLLVLGSSVVAWFLFAYLGWSIGRRAAVLPWRWEAPA